MHAPAERAPACTAALLYDIPQLHDGRADQPVLTREAVVLDADVQLVRIRVVLVAENTENIIVQINGRSKKC